MNQPNRLDRMIAYVAPDWARRRAASRRRLELAYQYRGAEQTRLRADWILGGQSVTPSGWELESLRNRSRDLNCNDPVASGATDTMGTNIVGRGLKLQSRMRSEALGVSPEQAQEWQRQAEAIWQNWTPLADAGNRLDWDELQFVALRKIVEDGEIIVLPVMAGEAWRPLKRSVELLEADRLCSPTRASQTLTTTQGVELGSRGEPVAYWLTRYDTQTGRSGQPQRVAARDSRGRPRVLHVYRTSRPGQCRGVPFFAPVLTYFKDLADYLEAEVVAARVAACLAVFVTKSDAYQAMGAMSGSTESSGARLQDLEPGLVHYLQLGENISVVEQKRGGETFNSFVEGVLRIIGVSLGLPYELLVKDFSKTNYSSARAALLEGRRMFMHWRAWFAARFCQPIYDLVLEEAWLRGQFQVRNFYEQRAEYTRALWLGGGWGWVDPVKEVQASKMAVDFGLSTLAEEAASQGRDWEEILDQLKREQDELKARGLEIPRLMGTPAGSGDKGDDDAQAEKK